MHVILVAQVCNRGRGNAEQRIGKVTQLGRTVTGATLQRAAVAYLKVALYSFFSLSFMFKSCHTTTSAVGPIVTKIGMMIPYCSPMY